MRKQIVHNAHVVRELEERGAVFVDDEPKFRRERCSSCRLTGLPRGSTSTPGSRQKTIDATCPLVTKVHVQARRYAAEGHRIVLIGHAGHEEVVGTMGEAPDATVLVESVEEAKRSNSGGAPVAYITQTTLRSTRRRR